MTTSGKIAAAVLLIAVAISVAFGLRPPSDPARQGSIASAPVFDVVALEDGAIREARRVGILQAARLDLTTLGLQYQTGVDGCVEVPEGVQVDRAGEVLSISLWVRNQSTGGWLRSWFSSTPGDCDAAGSVAWAMLGGLDLAGVLRVCDADSGGCVRLADAALDTTHSAGVKVRVHRGQSGTRWRAFKITFPPFSDCELMALDRASRCARSR